MAQEQMRLGGDGLCVPPMAPVVSEFDPDDPDYLRFDYTGGFTLSVFDFRLPFIVFDIRALCFLVPADAARPNVAGSSSELSLESDESEESAAFHFFDAACQSIDRLAHRGSLSLQTEKLANAPLGVRTILLATCAVGATSVHFCCEMICSGGAGGT